MSDQDTDSQRCTWDQRGQDHSTNHYHISPGLVGWCMAVFGFLAGALVGRLL
jgi:hypothetical protein